MFTGAAPERYHRLLRRTLYQMLGDRLLGRPNTDLLAEDAGAPPLSELTPSTWLEGTPLMRTLRARAAGGHDIRRRLEP